MDKNNNKNYIIREEFFGYTFFNRKSLRHRFVHKKDFNKILNQLGIKRNDEIFLPLKRKNVRKDIIYSPIRIYYELTLACNLRCKFCFNSAGKPRKRELTTKEIIKNLYDLKKENIINLHFTGGEFTLRPDWYTIFLEAKKLGFVISCNTNGVFLKKDTVSKLSNLNLDQITISIDGSKENHEKNRGRNTFAKSISSLKELHKLGANLRINTLVSKFSFNDVESMVDLASRYVKEINFFTVVFIGRGANLESKNSVTIKEHLAMSKKINKLRTKYPRLNILHFAQVTKETSIKPEEYDEFGLKVGPPSGTTTLNVTSDGGLYCGGYIPYIDGYLCLGNVKKDNIFDVWQNSKKLEEIRIEARKLMLFCNRCKEFINKKCQGSKYETELNRLIHPEVKNSCCVYGQGESLLKKFNAVRSLDNFKL